MGEGLRGSEATERGEGVGGGFQRQGVEFFFQRQTDVIELKLSYKAPHPFRLAHSESIIHYC